MLIDSSNFYEISKWIFYLIFRSRLYLLQRQYVARVFLFFIKYRSVCPVQPVSEPLVSSIELFTFLTSDCVCVCVFIVVIPKYSSLTFVMISSIFIDLFDNYFRQFHFLMGFPIALNPDFQIPIFKAYRQKLSICKCFRPRCSLSLSVSI